jgi:hypothetical protein
LDGCVDDEGQRDGKDILGKVEDLRRDPVDVGLKVKNGAETFLNCPIQIVRISSGSADPVVVGVCAFPLLRLSKEFVFGADWGHQRPSYGMRTINNSEKNEILESSVGKNRNMRHFSLFWGHGNLFIL